MTISVKFLKQTCFISTILQNPQIDRGIQVESDVPEEASGHAVRNYKPSLFEIHDIIILKNSMSINRLIIFHLKILCLNKTKYLNHSKSRLKNN